VKTVEDVRTNLPKAREALEACKQAGDRLTPQKLLHTSTGPVDLLEKEFEQLKNGESDSDKINLKQVQKLIEDLQAFLKDVSAYVRPDEKK
jgi:methionine synthase II (cobalamin-independent)